MALAEKKRKQLKSDLIKDLEIIRQLRTGIVKLIPSKYNKKGEAIAYRAVSSSYMRPLEIAEAIIWVQRCRWEVIELLQRDAAERGKKFRAIDYS